MKKLITLLVLSLGFIYSTFAQNLRGGGEAYPNLMTNRKALQKWQDMRFGLFVHWGPVSLRGTEIGWSRGKEVPIEDYDNLYKEFNPQLFDAREWVTIIKNAGMKYIVITSKHHDGFCIWDTEYTDYDIMSTPFKRDILKELADECKRQGILFGTYHSIADWHHPHYTTRYGGDPRPVEESDMNLYVDYLKKQIKELIEKYDTNILWFDGEWEVSWDHKKGMDLYKYARDLKDNILINNRVDKGRKGMQGMTISPKFAGDFGTPEQEIGAFHPDTPWESCITICRQWAWKPNDQMKSLRECIQTLARTAGGGGNLLLNVGPMLDGRIEQRQIDRLAEMGSWLKKNGESIYGTKGGPFEPTEAYVTTYKDNKIYVHILDWNGRNSIGLPSVTDREVKKAWILGDDSDADYSGDLVRQNPWGLRVAVPEDRQNKPHTIVVLEMEGDVSELKQPRVIDADQSKEIFLMGDAAKRIGTLEYNPGPDWISGWTDSSQSATWRVQLLEQGDYEVSMTYACLPGAQGSELEINTEKSSVKHTLTKTMGWAGESQSFEERVLDDKLNLSSGVNTITLRIKKNAGKNEVMKLYALKLISSEAKQAKLAAKERALKQRASTDWFVEAKYGVMFHWMPSTQPRRGPAKPFPDAVRDFDVETFADMVEETGAGYVIFTAPHGIQWFPGPSKTIEGILPGRTCDRDLIGDMADALAKRNIKLIQYYHHGVGDTEWLRASGFLSKDKSQFFYNEADILTEFGQRYGKKTAGYWFDDRYPMQPFEELYQATKAGNPDRIVAWNSWILPKSTEFQDYYAGEVAGALILPDTSYFGKNGPASGLQPHGLIFLDDPWHHGRPDKDIEPPRFNTKELIDHVKKCIDRKFVLTMNMGIYQDGTASPKTLKQLKALRKAVRN